MPGAGILALGAPLVPLRIAEHIRFGIQHRIEHLFDRTPYKFP
jgi:hypothetical protein